MDEIITNEYLQYKSVFLNGKWEILEAFEFGKIISFEEKFEKEPAKDWYHFGYEDGFQYFANLIDRKQLDLEKENMKEIIKEAFTNRVAKFNSDTGSEISIGKF